MGELSGGEEGKEGISFSSYVVRSGDSGLAGDSETSGRLKGKHNTCDGIDGSHGGLARCITDGEMHCVTKSEDVWIPTSDN